LSKEDVERAMAMLPNEGDSEELSRLKFESLDKLLTDAKRKYESGVSSIQSGNLGMPNQQMAQQPSQQMSGEPSVEEQRAYVAKKLATDPANRDAYVRMFKQKTGQDY
jgi:hypothetical protein